MITIDELARLIDVCRQLGVPPSAMHLIAISKYHKRQRTIERAASRKAYKKKEHKGERKYERKKPKRSAKA